jgi:hypothetical protein
MLTRNKALRQLSLAACKICDNYFSKNEYTLRTNSFPRIEELDL